MTRVRKQFGTVAGEVIESYAITNNNGFAVRFIPYGARMVEFFVPDKKGNAVDVVLGYDNLDAYKRTDHYLGAICGRFGNRIKRGQFTLNGQPYQLACNDGHNHLHGGVEGFDKKVWSVRDQLGEDTITFELVSRDGEEGYPGQVEVSVQYIMTEDNRLKIEMRGTAQEKTILNFVQHSLWNLAGHDAGTVLHHELKIESDFYTPIDDELLSTGEIRSVANTPFDFRSLTSIEKNLRTAPEVKEPPSKMQGYDHNWVLRSPGKNLKAAATFIDPKSGRGFDLYTSEPGLHVYTGGGLKQNLIGKNNAAYKPSAGITFETQMFPGSPNFSHFPNSEFNKGEFYEHKMEFRFFAQ